MPFCWVYITVVLSDQWICILANLLDTDKYFSKVDVLSTYTLIRSIWKLHFSISLAIILHIFNLFSCILGNTYIIDLIWISVVTNEVVHLSIGLLGIFIFTFMKVIKKSLVPSWVLNPFSLIYRYFSHILDTLLCQFYGL